MGNTDDEITYAVGSHISPNRYVVKDLESVRKIIISPETKKLDTSKLNSLIFNFNFRLPLPKMQGQRGIGFVFRRYF
jgi:hypothetical protein